jgi:undecaprenyl-diphosphatase
MEALLELDGQILLWIQEHIRNGILDPIMKGITHLGDGGIVCIIACIILMIIPKTRRLGVVCSCSLAATFILDNLLLKNLVARTRPYEAVDGLTRIVGAQSDYSFPSGHSGSVFAVAVVIFKETRKKIGVPTLLLALLVALSRLYVGVHYPTDVIVGILVGTVFAVLFCFVFHKRWDNFTAVKPAVSKYKLVMELDRDKISADGESIDKVAEAIKGFFTSNEMLDVSENGQLIFVTDPKDLKAFFNLSLATGDVEDSPFYKYLSVMEYHDLVNDDTEDWLAEAEKNKHDNNI